MDTNTPAMREKAEGIARELCATVPLLGDLIYPVTKGSADSPHVAVWKDKTEPIDLDALDEFVAVIKELRRLKDLAERATGHPSPTPHDHGEMILRVLSLIFELLISAARLPLVTYLVGQLEILRNRVRERLGVTHKPTETNHLCPICWQGSLWQHKPDNGHNGISDVLVDYQPHSVHTVFCDACARVWEPHQFLALGRRLRTPDFEAGEAA